MAASFHQTVRDAVHDALAAALAAAGVTLNGHAMAVPDPARFDKPCFVVSYEGAEGYPGTGTNLRDDLSFPVLVGLYTTDPYEDPPGCELTLFREVVRGAFHHKRLAGVADVLWCEVNPQPPVVGSELPAFKDLRTALTVVAYARRPRA